ncbi:MAG: fasciclin domain-containing protein [Pseudomonadota bacterium]
MMKTLTLAAAGLAAAAITLASASADQHETSGMHAEAPTIVGVAAGNDDFSTLVAAVTAADLVETLSGDGPFTVFAPTNDAFDALPDGTVEMLLEEENAPALRSVLTYHVVAGKVKAADLVALIRENGGSAVVETAAGVTFTAAIVDGDVTLTDRTGNAIKVLSTDVAASNGVIHVIDGVLLPTDN